LQTVRNRFNNYTKSCIALGAVSIG